MVTMAEKSVALAVVVLIDVVMLAFGGVLFAGAALIATLPFTVTIASR